VGHALSLEHAALVGQAHRALTAGETATINVLAARRLGGEPVARIVGHKEFWGLTLKLSRRTFVPRPDTETVVEAALAALAQQTPANRALRIADLGTGSGALLLALLSELPHSFGIGTDIDPCALESARVNAHRLCLPASFVLCSYGTALSGSIDVLVSNPPYIARGQIPLLEPEVREFDPRAALDGGDDGLDGYRAIAADAGRLLARGGLLVLELGWGQAAPVRSLLQNAGLSISMAKKDLSGTARALVARRLP
jgi:release factor glutamine methyltransferase